MRCAGEGQKRKGLVRLNALERTCFLAEVLEERRLLSFAVTFAGTPTLTQGADVNVTNLAGNQTETFIAANPLSPANLIAYSNTGTGNLVWYSSNGGAAWTQATIPAPANTAASSDRDPSIAFDRNGGAWLAYLADDTIDGSVNHIVLAKSVDGGQTWTSIDLASGVVYHPFVAIGENPSNPSSDNIYVTYREDVAEATLTDVQIHFRASTDGGATFPANVIINDDSIVGIDDSSYAALAIGPGGRIYAAWEDSSSRPVSSDIKLDTSADGGVTWGTDVKILIGAATATTGVTYGVGASGHYTIPAAPDQGILTVPSIAVARSGAYAGRVYVTYTFIAPGAGQLSTYAQTDVRMVFADNLLSGTPTWTAKKVNDDTNAAKSQFHPWMDLDQSTGFLYFTWFDARNSSSNNTAQRYSSFSTDGGTTIRANVRISDGASNESSTNSNRDRSNYGDFNVHSALGGAINAAWADNANQSSNDIYFDRVALNGQQVAATGSAGNDSYYLKLDTSGTFVQIFENTPASGTPAFTVLKSAMSSLALNLDAGEDTVTVDYSNGNPLPSGGLALSGIGHRTLTIVGTAATATYALNEGTTTITTANPANTAALSMSIATGAGVKFGSSVKIASLAVASDATAEIAAGATAGSKVLIVQSLSLVGTATLDLKNNGLVIDYAGTTALPAIEAMILAGYNAAGTHWSGDGITSSTAMATSETAVGSAEASTVLGPTGGTFLGQAVDATAVLVRYTLSGDANLSGTGDFGDLVAVSQNYENGLTTNTWSSGDSTFDGVVNFSDLVAVAQSYETAVPAGAAVATTAALVKSSATPVATAAPAVSSAAPIAVTSASTAAPAAPAASPTAHPPATVRRPPNRKTPFATRPAVRSWSAGPDLRNTAAEVLGSADRKNRSRVF